MPVSSSATQQQQQGNIFTHISKIFSSFTHRPSLWTNVAAKERSVPAYNNTIASLRR
ncbi:unnamed protein product [Ectocarpus sp. 6 AP-2014]